MKIELLVFLVIGCIYVNASPIHFHDGTSFDPMEGGLHPHITGLDIRSASNLDRPQSLLVQLDEGYLKGSVSAHRDFEADANIRIVQSLPKTTFIVHASPRNLQAVSGNIIFVGQVMPQLKLSKTLTQTQENQCIYAPHGIVIEVVRESHGSSRSLETLTSGWEENLEGLEMRYDSINDVESSATMSTVSVYVTASKDDARFTRCSKAWSNAANFLSAEQEVIYLTTMAHPDTLNMYARLATMDRRRSQPTNVNEGKQSTLFNGFYQRGITGENVTVHVVDEGIDLDHMMFYDPDMPDVPLGSPSMHRKFALVNDPYSHYPEHGTHVAATIAGAVPGQRGHKKLVANCGIAPKAKVAFDNFYANPSNFTKVMSATGARVQSNSWGFVVDTPNVCDQTTWFDFGIDNAYYDNKYDSMQYYNDYMLQVFAAGNDGEQWSVMSTVSAPATAKNVLSVGATNSDNRQSAFAESLYSNERNSDTLAPYSSVGPTVDGRIKPDLVAIGDVLSADGKSYRTYGGTDLIEFQGTSMATPVISGLAALVQDYFQKGFYPGGEELSGVPFTPKAVLLKAMLINGGTPIKRRSRITSAGDHYFLISPQIGEIHNIGQKYMGYSGLNSYSFTNFDVNATRFLLNVWSTSSFDVYVDGNKYNSTAWSNCGEYFYEFTRFSDLSFESNGTFDITVSATGDFFLQTTQTYIRRSTSPKMNLKCGDTFASLGMQQFEVYDIACPFDCENESVYGSTGYHPNSSVCASARHSGAISDDSKFAYAVASYIVQNFTGLAYNGINSTSMYSDEMDYAFQLVPDRRTSSHEDMMMDSPNMLAGFGRVDLPSILPFKPKNKRGQMLIVHSFGDESESIADGGNHTYCFTSKAMGVTIKTTLTWFDIPNDFFSFPQIILNLDLEVQKIGQMKKGGIFRPTRKEAEVLYPNGRSSADITNNVEQITLKAKKGEVYCARVIASSFLGAASSVKYALVTSGPVVEFTRD